MPEIVTKKELEEPRSAAEMLDWVQGTLRRFNTKQLKAEAREGKHFAKELADEALPIALFARSYYDNSPNVMITHVIGSQQFDAMVNDDRQAPSSIQHIEATVSDRNFTEALRMEILNKKGSVAAYGKVVAKGPKGKRSVLEAESIAVKHDDVHEQHLEAVAAAVAKKAKIEYPPHTALVVRVDDAGPFRGTDDVSALDELAQASLAPKIAGREFDVLALVGSQGLYLAYELTGK